MRERPRGDDHNLILENANLPSSMVSSPQECPDDNRISRKQLRDICVVAHLIDTLQHVVRSPLPPLLARESLERFSEISYVVPLEELRADV